MLTLSGAVAVNQSAASIAVFHSMVVGSTSQMLFAFVQTQPDDLTRMLEGQYAMGVFKIVLIKL